MLGDAPVQWIAYDERDHRQADRGRKDADGSARAARPQAQAEECGDEDPVLEVGEDSHLRADPPDQQHLEEEDQRGDKGDADQQSFFCHLGRKLREELRRRNLGPSDRMAREKARG